MADLITLEEYKDAENINTTKDDTRLSALIVSVSQLVKTYCANSIIDFYSTNKTETFNIDWNSHIVQLTESPIVSIVSVEERDSYQESYTTLTTTAHEYFLDEKTDSIIRTNSGNTYKNWPRGAGSVRVVYKAGYASPIRKPRGEDIMAACGQLKSASKKITKSAQKAQKRNDAEA